jgi:predicted nucleotidyltransferase
MTVSWYKSCLPRVSDAKQALSELVDNLKKIQGVKNIYVFGSFVKNFNKPNYRIKDVNIIIGTPFHSGDLMAINHRALSSIQSILEDEGFDPVAVKFSKELSSIKNVVPIDAWALSSDKKMLHWGPMIANRQESDEVHKEAEEYATKETGFNLKKIQTANPAKRKNWYSTYKRYIQAQLGDMPSGWYASETDAKEIIKKSILISFAGDHPSESSHGN